MNDEGDVMEMDRQPVMDMNRHEKKDEGKLYAPDSSSDEELGKFYIFVALLINNHIFYTFSHFGGGVGCPGGI